MTDAKPDRWMTWVALTTAIMAVFAAITTLYVGKYSSRTIMHQAQETNEWSYYQAKSIKSYIYEIQKQKLELEMLMEGAKRPKAVADKVDKVLADYDGKIKRYEKEKDEIKQNAEALAKSKAVAQEKAGNFGYSLIFLQIAIMLSSVAALTKRKMLWYFGLATCTGWAFFFLDAIYLFY